MELLKSGFKSVLGSQQPGANPTGADTVERLVHRVQSATLLEDRRDAVRALKSLSKKFRLEVGTQAMDSLITVLEVDRNDAEIIGYALDTLTNVMSQELVDEDGVQIPQDESNDLGESFTEIFVKRSENVSTLLGLLEEFDSHVRWPAIRLLTCLLINKLRELQEIILVIPMGVSRLMDLLSDSREFIRNDALLLLIHLTRSHANIQKIVAFENAFDRLLDIILEEGNSDGGIIVEDCLSLLLNLLKNNTSNQTFFKEGSFVQRLAPFFSLFSEGVEKEWSAQKVININLMLQIVRSLVAPSNPFQVSSASQKVMNTCGLLQQLCSILMATGVPADTLSETINTVSEVIRGNHANQEYFASVTAPCNPPRQAIVVLLMSMVNEKQPLILRCAVLYCIQCFLYRNELGQAQIIQTLLPASIEANTCTAGQLLCAGLVGQDSLSTWCAAVALSHALVDNTPQKEQLLRVQLAMNIGSPPVSLLQQCTILLQQGTKVQTRLGLLMLLCTWLSNCPSAVAHFVSISTNVPFLTSQVVLAEGDDQETLVQGICAFLLGICVQFNDDSVISFSREALCQLIDKRIGLEMYFDKLGQVSKHEVYSQAAQKPQPKYKHANDVLFDYEFCRLFKSLEGTVIKAVAPKPKESLLNGPEANLSEAQHSLLMQYKNLIREQDQQLSEIKQKYEDLQNEHKKSVIQVEEMSSSFQQLKDQNALLKAHRGTQQNSTEGGIAEVTQLKAQIEELKKQLTNQEADAVENLQSQANKLSLEPSEADQRPAVNVEEYTQEIANLQTLLSEKEAELKKAEEETAKLRQSLSQQSNEDAASIDLIKEHEELKKEQEDLLVLLTEQEEKITKYKARLQELGEKVEDDDDFDIDNDLDLDSEN